MDCRQIEHLLVDYAEHDLTPVLRARVAAHVNHCYHCSEQLAEISEALETARQSLRHPEPVLRYEALWAAIEETHTPTLLDFRPKLTVGAALKYVTAAAASILLLIGAGDAVSNTSLELRPAVLQKNMHRKDAPVNRYISYCARVESVADTVENSNPPLMLVPESSGQPLSPTDDLEPLSQRDLLQIFS